MTHSYRRHITRKHAHSHLQPGSVIGKASNDVVGTVQACSCRVCTPVDATSVALVAQLGPVKPLRQEHVVLAALHLPPFRQYTCNAHSVHLAA